MSYKDPYADPYYGNSNPYHTNDAAGYGHNQYSDPPLDYNPYSQRSHPTYDQGGYGPGAHEEQRYTDEPVYPPQRKPTHRTQHSEPDEFHQRKDSYQPGAEGLHQRKESYQSGVEFSSTTRPRKTASALRQYRYDHQGALWTKGGRGRCIGRFCCCSLMTVVFLIVSIALALALWVRPPGIIIGDIAPVSKVGTSTIETKPDGDGVSFTIHLALNITVNNPNYFSVNFKKIKADLTYPINDTSIGGGEADNVVFPTQTQTDWTFPIDIVYSTSADPKGLVLADLLSKCGANKSNINVDYKISLGLQILFVSISPTVSNTVSFPCPLDEATIKQITGGKIPAILGA